MSTEHERITRIRRLLARPSQSLWIGIGDDCAVLAPSAHPQVWTVDAAVEEVHFSRAFMSEREIGYRALMGAASDIAAMGASARAALCALALPAAFDERALDALLAGLAEASDALDMPIAGGNLTRARELSLTISVLGECRGKVLTRAAAQPGDALFVSGPLGGAALGLAALRAGRPRRGDYGAAIERFLRPRARLDLALGLAGCASAAIDLSDGLQQDLGHLCAASGVGARLELTRVPALPGFEQLANALGLESAALLLGGGEDYELLFSAPPGSVPAQLGAQIGVIEGPAGGVRVLAADGSELPAVAGFDHFR